MTLRNLSSRRAFLAASGAGFFAVCAKTAKVPIGLELYSVRDVLQQDLMGTVRAVAKMGYEGVEFYSPYFQWTTEKTREVRSLLDELGIRCFSTHNSASALAPENIGRAIELNQILGSEFIVVASAGRVEGLDGWKQVAANLTAAAEKLKPTGMRAGFHNHKTEFVPLEGTMPMEVLAANTPREVVLQLDVGTCLEAGVDPVAWIQKNPGRINSIHCKEWSKDPAVGYRALLGEGAARWKEIFAAAEKTGGVKHYLVEQEGSRYSSMETAERCLAAIRKLRG
jgi:sugar phosphate isomerase/epimerase